MLKNSKLLEALNERDVLKARLSELESAIKETAEYLVNDAGGNTTLQVGNEQIEIERIERIVPKWKEVAFEIAGDHPERIQAVTDSNPKLLNRSVSYKVNLKK